VRGGGEGGEGGGGTGGGCGGEGGLGGGGGGGGFAMSWSYATAACRTMKLVSALRSNATSVGISLPWLVGRPRGAGAGSWCGSEDGRTSSDGSPSLLNCMRALVLTGANPSLFFARRRGGGCDRERLLRDSFAETLYIADTWF
jgi:hypothetical protein